MTKPAKPETSNWIVSLKKDATAAETTALAEKIDALGKPNGFKTVDYFPGLILVKSDEAFAREIEQKFAAELRSVSPEKKYPLPDTRPKLRKPPTP